jgi:hypothetical protein
MPLKNKGLRSQSFKSDQKSRLREIIRFVYNSFFLRCIGESVGNCSIVLLKPLEMWDQPSFFPVQLAQKRPAREKPSEPRFRHLSPTAKASMEFAYVSEKR